MNYIIKNLTYSPLRLLIDGKEYLIPGRDDLSENSVTVPKIDLDIRNLSVKGLIKIRQVK
jgi:hypothetical protein